MYTTGRSSKMISKWPMYLTEQLEKAAETHGDDTSKIASIVGADYESRGEFIEALIEELLFLKQDWDPEFEFEDVYGPGGEGPTRGEAKEPIGLEIIRGGDSVLMVFSKAGDVRKMLLEQRGDHIAIESVSTPNRDADATILLKEYATEIHDAGGTDTSLRFEGKADKRPSNPLYITDQDTHE